jgi:hypothetical protein
MVVYNGLSLTANALVDTGANGYIFVNRSFADKIKKFLPVEVLKDPIPVPVGGYKGSIDQEIEEGIKTHLRIQGRFIRDQMLVVVDMNHELILGRKFMDYYDLLVDTRRRRLLFPDEMPPGLPATDIRMDDAGTLLKHPSYDADVRRREVLMSREDKRRRDGRMEDRKTTDEDTGPLTEKPEPLTHIPQILKSNRYSHLDPARTAMAQMERELSREELPPQPEARQPRPRPKIDTSGVKLDINVIGAAPFMTLAKKGHLGVTSLYEIDRFIQDRQEMDLAARSLTDDKEELRHLVETKVPKDYSDYYDVFSKVRSDELPPYRRGVDHKIDLIPDARPEELNYSPLYKMSVAELETCRQYILDNLAKGFIEPSSAPWAAPILFALKSDGGLRFCVDYRKLNAITRKDRYPLPLIEETISRISKAKIFTKIDIRQAFHRIRMNPDDEELTTFRTRYGAYKYKVLPFGLTNGPSTFQRFINDTLMGYLDDFCSAYIDDILIYSDSVKEHKAHVKKVLQRLREAGLQADIKKCEFHVTETKYLGFIIGTDGIAVDPEKIAAVENWQRPQSVKGVQSFLGFCNFYRKFVRDYGRIASPLNQLTHKGQSFAWTEDCQVAFDELKRRLLTAPILRHFSYDSDVETRVETDSSDGVVAGVLQQRGKGGNENDWHPVAFFSETMHGAEHNYPIHDKELLAVVRALQCWRSELVGLPRPFTVITDHEALKYFGTKRLLNGRQAGWAELLSQYNFVLTYRPGKQNALADALSRKAEELRTQKDKKEAQRTMRIFKPETEVNGICLLDRESVEPSNQEEAIMLTDSLMAANHQDPDLEGYRQKARKGDPTFTMLQDKYVLHQGRLIVSATDNLRTRVIREVHDPITSAHPGRNKTKALVAQRYWWPGLPGTVDQYLANCQICLTAKKPRSKTPGLLQPLPVPDRTWYDIVVDFKKMPEDRHGFNNALVMICRLGKASWTVPCRDNATAADAARMYYEGPFRVYGLPQTIVSDRGPQFISEFTREVSKILKINWKLANSGHSQTAGQAEIMNAYFDQRLRPYVNHYQDNWSEATPAMDCVQASMPHESLGGLSPHEVMRGFPMPLQYDWENRTRKWDSTRDKVLGTEAQKWAETIHGYMEHAKKCVREAQERMKAQADRHRKDPDIKVGDRVFILKKSWSTQRPSDKLDFPMTRQHFEVLSTHGNSFKLKVPDGWKATDTFNADRLRKYPNNPLPGQANENPPGEMLDDDEEEWEVERITASRLFRHKLQYQAEWKGWDPDTTWYDAENFKNATAKIREFHKEFPNEAGPPARLAEWEQAALADEFLPTHKDDNKPASTRKGTGTRTGHGKK